MRLTALLTTIAREDGLPRMLRSLSEQNWEEGDELLVVSDTNHDRTHQLLQGYGLPARHIGLMDGPHKDNGHTPRNITMGMARGTHIWHIDDDDIAMPGALDTIRQTVQERPEALNVFRFLHYGGAVIWKMPEPFMRHNVGTPCMVHPHPQDCQLGEWAPFFAGDNIFVNDTIRRSKREVLWHDRFIYLAAAPRAMSLYQCYLFALNAQILRDESRGWHLVPPKETWTDMTTLVDCPPLARADAQSGWQWIANTLFRNCTVLDVGSGFGMARERMPDCKVTTQDIAPGLPVDRTTSVHEIEPKSYDVVTAFDVLEHVVDDIGFLADLCQIARKAVFLSTPNWLVSRARNPYHVREYTPSALAAILTACKASRFWVGKSDGSWSREVDLTQFCDTKQPHLAVLLNMEAV